mmetsp:Transcript_56341/g.151631  ORF Transcript_56341/g.151631 Transcript_56341/m.151631 type:complete len:201 (+) Transcript_56341:544-1146(+)
MHTNTFLFNLMANFKTNFVCGMGPSCASTNSTHASAMFKMRSTSPPKSACPGVSMRLILTPLYSRAAFLAKIVIPRSASKTLLSMDAKAASSLPRVCFMRLFESVVLPWSTWPTVPKFMWSLTGPAAWRTTAEARVCFLDLRTAAAPAAAARARPATAGTAADCCDCSLAVLPRSWPSAALKPSTRGAAAPGATKLDVEQ